MRTLRPECVLSVVDRLYEAAARPELWRDILHEVAQAVGAEGITLIYSQAAQNPLVVHSEAMDRFMSDFVADTWHLRNDRVKRGLPLLRRGQSIVTEEMLFSREEYAREPMHMELLRPHGLGHFAGLKFASAVGADILLAIERSGSAEPFAKSEIELLTQIQPHIERAGQLALAVGLTHGQGVLDAFALLDRPALLLDVFGTVLRLNPGAERMLGPDLSVRQGMLTAFDRTTNAALQRLIGEVLSGASDATAPPVPVARALGRPLIVHGAPLVGSARDPFRAAKAVLTIIDPDVGREPGELLLQQACGLTAAEACTALRLACGQSPEEIAQARGVGIETARWQVKSIAAKVDAHGRGALVALLNRVLLGLLHP